MPSPTRRSRSGSSGSRTARRSRSGSSGSRTARRSRSGSSGSRTARSYSPNGNNTVFVNKSEVIEAKVLDLFKKQEIFLMKVRKNMTKDRFSDKTQKPESLKIRQNKVGLYIKNLIIYNIIKDRLLSEHTNELHLYRLNSLFFTLLDNNNFTNRHWLIFDENTDVNSTIIGTLSRKLFSKTDSYNLKIKSDILEWLKVRTKKFIDDVLIKKSGAKDTFKAFIETLGKETEEGARLVRNTKLFISVNTLPNTLEIRMRELLKDIPRGESELDSRFKRLLNGTRFNTNKRGGRRISKKTLKRKKV
jgi:hypothetical protein